MNPFSRLFGAEVALMGRYIVKEPEKGQEGARSKE
jgi:hypothetical protein